MDAAIEPLPDVTRSKLRSTQILTSLSQIVSELLQNSLDAGARQIDIGVDCEEWNCWVRDDGSGMSKDGMGILGTGLDAGRYGTSKAYAPDSLDNLSAFGFRGEALASCADICCLEISSRTARSMQTWSIIVKGAKTLYNGPAVRWRRESPGTTVCIRDAFYNLPVRRLSHPTPARTLDAIRHEIETFALVFPNVAFTLENTHSGKDDKDMLLRIPKTTSMLTAFRHIYGRALAQHVEEIDATSGELRLRGFISLDGAYSKTCQFLYINRHPISLCELHHVIDSHFASSSFAKHAFDEAGETSLRSTVRRSPRKSEKKPVYVLDLSIPSQQIDNCLEPAKAAVHLRNKNVVASLLGSTVQAFLIRHGFSSENKANVMPRGSPSPSPRKRRKYDFEDDSGYAEPGSENPTFQQLFREASPAPLYTSEETAELLWTDAHTGQIYVVNARTGNSYRKSEPPPVDSDGGIPCNPQGPTLARQKAGGIESLDKPEMPDWIQKALEANDTYTVTEKKIPSLTHLPAPDADAETHQHDCHEAQKFSDYLKAGQPYGDSTSASSRRFQKEDLRNAQVIEQVDRKFIACLINDSSTETATATTRTLVLIDQHAADERVRVERFLKELCLGYLSNVNAGDKNDRLQLRDLSPLVPILLTRHEERQLRDLSTRRVFGHWGFRFVEPAVEAVHETEQGIDAGSANGYSQVFVQGVPELVADKLLLDDELRDFVKAFLAKVESDPPRAQTDAENDKDDEFRWLRALRWCPQQLLDLVNSKACRGAIMFNDPLTHAQCEKLVDNLRQTAFPFQCAHGRPSLAPLIDLGKDHARRQKICRWSSLGGP
ncbi:hypothetical protein DFH08DRAFT_31742 [Mycena albidolilacea]|uniref:MutL C-terminal dimerisation domain-containing protein n=1 Tax=Mycena albidolilacea TaxID=1033008 RepID=A0AAD7AVS3_9AGAR|nr:hypothetical protein DFH08DRAFT_31742 [Mycena albidolilacea]